VGGWIAERIGLKALGSALARRFLASTAGRLAARGVGQQCAVAAGRLSSGGSAPMSIVRYIQPGEKLEAIVDEAKGLTMQNNVEHAVVRLSTGERALVSGGHTGIEFPAGSIRRIIGHTHPYDVIGVGPSDADRAALRQLGQKSSWLFERGSGGPEHFGGYRFRP
jgi:hypothetical protein